MLDVIAEIIVGVLFQYPGAFIRWVIFRKKSFKEYLDADLYVNIFPVAVLIAIILVIVKILK